MENSLFPYKYDVGQKGIPPLKETLAEEINRDFKLNIYDIERFITPLIRRHREQAREGDRIIITYAGENEVAQNPRDWRLASELKKRNLEDQAFPLVYRVGQRKIPNPRKIYKQLKLALGAKIGDSSYWAEDAYVILRRAVSAVSRLKGRSGKLQAGDEIIIQSDPADPVRPPKLWAHVERSAPKNTR